MKDVIAYIGDDVLEGKLEWTIDGPVIHAGNAIHRDGVKYKTRSAKGPVSKKNQDTSIELARDVIINLKPVETSIRGYSREPTEIERIYPPSTLSWFSHYTLRKNPAVYFIQETNWKTKVWLTCIDYYSREILFSHPVNQYEEAGLWVSRGLDFWLVYRYLRAREGLSELVEYFDELLSKPPPDWDDLMKLTKDAPLKQLKRGENMRRTLEPLIPSEVHESLRYEIMAFLAWALTREPGLPKNDPIEISQKFFAAPTFIYLVNRHLAFLLYYDRFPKYIQFIHIADEFAKRSKDYDRAFVQKFHELSDALIPPISFQYDELTVDNILDELNKLRSSSRKNKSDWLRLLHAITNYARLRGEVNYEALGLKQMVYFGAAYRWPYKHLSWWVELNEGKTSNRRLHSLLVPPRIIPKLTRIFPAEPVDWSVRVMNKELLDSSGNWHVAWNRMLRSANTETKLSSLVRKYGPEGTIPVVISKRDTELLDRLYLGFHLSYLMDGFEVSPSEKFTTDEISERLDFLSSNGVLYNLHVIDNSLRTIHRTQSNPLETIMMRLQGNSSGILSIVRALLRYTPSCNAFLTQNCSQAYILSRIIKDGAKLAELADVANTNDVQLEVYHVKSYLSVAATLLQRLWMDEGKWDDDLSTLLSQSQYRVSE